MIFLISLKVIPDVFIISSHAQTQGKKILKTNYPYFESHVLSNVLTRERLAVGLEVCMSFNSLWGHLNPLIQLKAINMSPYWSIRTHDANHISLQGLTCRMEKYDRQFHSQSCCYQSVTEHLLMQDIMAMPG